jgi:hypothetical protein
MSLIGVYYTCLMHRRIRPVDSAVDQINRLYSEVYWHGDVRFEPGGTRLHDRLNCVTVPEPLSPSVACTEHTLSQR